MEGEISIFEGVLSFMTAVPLHSYKQNLNILLVHWITAEERYHLLKLTVEDLYPWLYHLEKEFEFQELEVLNNNILEEDKPAEGGADLADCNLKDLNAQIRIIRSIDKELSRSETKQQLKIW